MRTTWAYERLFSIEDIPRQKGLPVERVSRTWRRWVDEGWKRGARRHRLPTTLVNGVKHTSLEAIREFIAMLGDHSPPKSSLDGQGGRVNRIKEQS